MLNVILLKTFKRMIMNNKNAWKKGKKQIGFWVSEEDYKLFKKYCDDRLITTSRMFRKILNDFLIEKGLKNEDKKTK